MRTAARFPAVTPDAGHYESFYLKAADPAGGRSLWIRHTIHRRPGAKATCAVWMTLFDAEEWVWIHASTAAGGGPDDYLDVAAGRVKVGPLTTPWIANGSVGAAPERFVGFTYSDPGGGSHDSLNCSISDLEARVERPGRHHVHLEATAAAVYEHGTRDGSHGIPIEPYEDG